MNIAGLIFSSGHSESIPELTSQRTVGSIPFLCRYRLIDFPLSNMVNANITNIGIITDYNYRSLFDHIGNGKDWDLSRRSGGIKFIPPNVTAFDRVKPFNAYENKLHALINAKSFISRSSSDYIVISDSSSVMTLDIESVIKDHINSCAFMTLVTRRVKNGEIELDSSVNVVTTGENNQVRDVSFYKEKKGESEVFTGTLIIATKELEALIELAISRSYSDFKSDILERCVKKKLVRSYFYEGYYAYFSSLTSYYKQSLKVLNPEVQKMLFDDSRRIYTKLRNSPPVKYLDTAKVKNSLIADGCIIEGEVENSLIFRGVEIQKGAKVKNSILLQDSFVGENSVVNCVISDKNVIIKPSRFLSGHETLPFFISKGGIV